jgi:beta-glucanase (GH16 family)
LGTELFSKTSFALPRNPSQGLQFEARVRLLTDTAGLVASFFTWGAKTRAGRVLTDEIDFEDLTTAESGSMLLTSFNDWDATNQTYGDGIHHADEMVTTGMFQRDTWHTLQIQWWSDHTEWYINGQLVRSSTAAHPNDPMTVRFNFWAPASDWNAAYSYMLPSNVTYFYDIDYVRVTLISRLGATR